MYHPIVAAHAKDKFLSASIAIFIHINYLQRNSVASGLSVTDTLPQQQPRPLTDIHRWVASFRTLPNLQEA